MIERADDVRWPGSPTGADPRPDHHRRGPRLLRRRRRHLVPQRHRGPGDRHLRRTCAAAPRPCTQAIVDLRRIAVPVIAAINGPAAGAGFSLALACDIRIAADGAFFAPAYGRIGASPDGGMTYFLPRVVGPAKALELLLDDPNMSAADALRDGLVSEVVAPDELIGRARERKAEKLAAMAPHYVKMAKTPGRRQHRELPHRAPPTGAPRHRRQHGDRGSAQRRHRLLRRREARVRRQAEPARRRPKYQPTSASTASRKDQS